jgi:hypothetical protein
MSHDQEQDIDFVIQRLREKIGRLKEQQTSTENMATLMGMTSEDSEQYKKRHTRIRNLTKKLGALNDQKIATSGGRYD